MTPTSEHQTLQRMLSLDDARWARLYSLSTQYFEHLPIAGRRILDVGAGMGVYSMWLRAIGHAHEVVALEPSLGVGGHSDIADRARARFKECGLGGLEVAQYTLQDYPIPKKKFDAVVSLNSINHLDEVEISLEGPSDARTRYEAIFAKLYALLKPGGDLMMTDSGRFCLERYTHRIGVPRLFTQGIEYNKHQQPSTWAKLAEEAGFMDVRWWGIASAKLRPLGSLARHPVTNFLTNGGFILQARRSA